MPNDRLSRDEKRRLEKFFGDIKAVRVEPLRRAEPGMAMAGETEQIIDALALAYSGGGDSTAAWNKFIRRYMPEPDIAGMYGVLRSRGVHNLSAGEGLCFVSGDDHLNLHGTVTDDGRTVLHVASLAGSVDSSFEAFREDALNDPEIGRTALMHFERFPPVGVVEIRVADAAISASATSSESHLRLANEQRVTRRQPADHKRRKRP